jgi:DNA-binding response OmpR family regulator
LDERTHPERLSLIASDADLLWEVEYQAPPDGSVRLRPPRSYRQALGESPIELGLVEFRIMLFLSRRPYHAYTRREIAEALEQMGSGVAEESIDAYVASLRDQLGVFYDFVQPVPHVGYRFKA